MLYVYFTIDNIIQTSLGGGLLRHLRYASRLQTRGIQFEWFTLESDVDEQFEEKWHTRVHVVTPDAGMTHQQKRNLLMHKAIEHASWQPAGNAVICTSTSGMTWKMILLLWFGKLRGITCLYNTTIMPGPLPTTFLGKLRLVLLNTIFFKEHALVIAQTKRLAEFYESYFHVPASKVEVIGNGVDCSYFVPGNPKRKALVRERLGLPPDSLVVLSVGSVVPRKGIQQILKAWPDVLSKHPNAKLVIAGTLGRRSTFVDDAADLDDYAREIRDLVQALPDPSSVVLSAQHVHNVLDYYQSADVFAFASELEGLPNAVLEAMSCGLPVLLGPYDGFPADGEEFGHEGTHFLKCERDPSSITEGLLRLLEDPPLCETLGKSARQLMLSTQDLSQILDRWAAMCRRVAATAYLT